MNMDEEEYDAYAYGSGCGLHGEEFLCECTMCGIEYCSACFRHPTLCADCAAQAAFDDEEAVPTDDDKDILLASEFNDDEPPEPMDFDPTDVARKPGKSKPAPKSRAKPKAKAKPKVKAKPKAKAKPKVKVAPKAKSKAAARKPKAVTLKAKKRQS